MFGEKKENRFISIICERGKYNERMMVYVDTETGIQYLHVGGDNEGVKVCNNTKRVGKGGWDSPSYGRYGNRNTILICICLRSRWSHDTCG